MDHMRADFQRRWVYDRYPHLKPAEAAMHRAFEARDNVIARTDTLMKDRTLSPFGRQAALKAYIEKFVAPEMRKVQTAVDSLRARNAVRRERVTAPPKFDKGDAAAAQLRGEIRTMLRGMKPGERATHLLNKNADEKVVLAALEAPFLAGIDDEMRDKLVTLRASAMFPGELKQIEVTDEAADMVHAANRIALMTLQRALDLPNESMAAEFVKAQTARIGGTLDANVEREIDAAA